MAKPDISNIIERMKNLRQFTVEVDLPDGLELHGVMPFDISIKKNKGWFKVYALNMEEATEKVNEFVKSMQ